MMDDGYISELVKKFKESISQEESELVDRFKEYLQIAIMSIKNNESKFINKDDESIRSVVTKMANDLIYASLETKKRVLIEDKNLIRINEYSNQAYKDATKIVMGDSEAIEYDIDKRIDEINYLLEEVKEYNKDIAKKMVSEIILDLNFIKNPKTGITSLRLGHFIRVMRMLIIRRKKDNGRNRREIFTNRHSCYVKRWHKKSYDIWFLCNRWRECKKYV